MADESFPMDDISRQSEPTTSSTDQGFATGDSFSSSDFDSIHALSTSSRNVTNPFSTSVVDNLGASVFSPSVFKTPINKIQLEEQRQLEWSIEHKSILFPAKIDESFYYESPVDLEKSVKTRKALDDFWAVNKQIAPSPMVTISNHIKGPSFTPSPITSSITLSRRTSYKSIRGQESPLSRNQNMYVPMTECQTQTDVSIPTDIDFDFDAVIQQHGLRRQMASTPKKETNAIRFSASVASPEASIIHGPRNLFADSSFDTSGCFIHEADQTAIENSSNSNLLNSQIWRGDIDGDISELATFDSFGLPPMSPITENIFRMSTPTSPVVQSPSRVSFAFQSSPQPSSSFSHSGIHSIHKHLETIPEDG